MRAAEVERCAPPAPGRSEGPMFPQTAQRIVKDPIVGESAAIRHVCEQADQVAATDSTVLLLGETGTGKELFAARIHEASGRRTRPMVSSNVGAIPATLLESELFGRERGAYTGAGERQIGRFELSDRSTIFLDEIGDLPLEVQVKLLRAIEERQIERLGSVRPIKIDTRIIAATHRDLEQGITQANMEALQRYPWRGNIRELRNAIERAMIVTDKPRLQVAIPMPPNIGRASTLKLVDIQREHIRRVLETAAWRIRGSGGAADRLGLRPTTLETRMAKLGLTRPR